MGLERYITLAFQLSIFATVFGFGLKTTTEDMLCMIRRPSVLARSLVAMFVIMPIVAVAASRAFDFPYHLEIALVAFAISPLPTLIPKKLTKVDGRASHAVALMATVGLLS